jgi:hypothetical protein
MIPHFSVQELDEGASCYPFSKVTQCNTGNPHHLEQPPITFFRQVRLDLVGSSRHQVDEGNVCWLQVFALMECPELITRASHLFESDAIARAQIYLKHAVSVGAYSHSKGWVSRPRLHSPVMLTPSLAHQGLGLYDRRLLISLKHVTEYRATLSMCSSEMVPVSSSRPLCMQSSPILPLRFDTPAR